VPVIFTKVRTGAAVSRDEARIARELAAIHVEYNTWDCNALAALISDFARIAFSFTEEAE